MAALLFYVGENRYAVDNTFVLKVFPRISLKKMPSTPPYLAGLMNWSGIAVPIIDFSQLIEQRDSRLALNTRIILLQNLLLRQVIGIIGEKVTDILQLNHSQFSGKEFNQSAFPYLNGIYTDSKGIIQYVDVDVLFKFLNDRI